MKCSAVAIVTLSMFLVSGCFIKSSITRLDGVSNVPAVPFSKLTSLENVSGSNVYTRTAASGFKVKQSAGMIVNKQLAKTQNGYKVYLHASGRITSGEESQ